MRCPYCKTIFYSCEVCGQEFKTGNKIKCELVDQASDYGPYHEHKHQFKADCESKPFIYVEKTSGTSTYTYWW